ncbi:MAG: nucleotidyl transferase AbiEii/AbiGii toxin family protein [Bacteroidales bacterium]|jgi:predicted nucleotidyltransferase component of viral defense system|nr:nucleotidyl transferase AbiEii/AbiGii toxin family protein [Bacteroidales bacterium]
MIPRKDIEEWTEFYPWKQPEKVEQDLIICRALCALYSDEYLAEHLAFRGGTTLNKIYLHPQPRYSEDIDLVQINAEPIKETMDKIRNVLSFLGKPKIKQKERNNTFIYRFNSEVPPIVPLRLKVEINCREHFNVLGFVKHDFSIESSWFSSKCKVTTYYLEELLGTKLRALYQRRKGRDLFDLYKALTTQKIDIEKVIRSYRKYMSFVTDNLPSQQEYMQNMELKMRDDEFLGDITALLRPDEKYEPQTAWNLIKTSLIEKL